MKYYIAADGGGTKLNIILYDENLRVISSTRMRGTNTNLIAEEELAEEMYQHLRQLIPEYVTEIESMGICVLKFWNEFMQSVSRCCPWKKCIGCSEGGSALAAAGYPYGVVALAGTGSGVVPVQPEGDGEGIGGWGYLLGDEGSGYDIGRQALKAVLNASEYSGPKTIMTEMIMEEWELSRPRDLTMKVMTEKDFKSLIASVSYIAARAARQQDAVALRIYEQAGHELSKQVFALLDSRNGEWEGPILASGGAWKGCTRMFECFSEDIRNKYPDALVIHPIYEPVVGCVIRQCMEDGRELGDLMEDIEREFGEFLYKRD